MKMRYRPVSLPLLAVVASGALVTASWAMGLPREPAPFSTAAPGDALPSPWRHQLLPKVKTANQLDLVRDGGVVALRVRSSASASTAAQSLDVDTARTPVLTWRWKVSNPVAGSDFTRKSGDDYAARVYVLFDYPLEKLSLADRIAATLARTLHGAELPTAAITYVWGTAQAVGASGPNPYTDRARMIVVNSGTQGVGEWVEVRRDVAADFRALFGEAAPRVNGIAVSADTDNTGEEVTAWFGDLRFLPKQ